MKVSLPEPLQAFVDAQVAEGGYATDSDFIGALIRAERDRQSLRGLLLDGAASVAGGVADGAYFSALRDKLRASPRP